MTNERDQSDHVDTADELVSRTYRELAAEQVPDRLNETILRRAARAARPPYARSILWTKPVAWAAMIAICLAITLQVTELTKTDGMPPEVPATEAEQARPVPGTRSDTFGAQPQASETAVGGATEVSVDTPSAAQSKQSVAEQTPAAAAALEQRVPEEAPDDVLTEETTAPAALEFELQDADLLRRAEERDRVRAGPDREARQPLATAVTTNAVGTFESGDSCDDEARAEPETWYACISRLEQAGLIQQAKEERKLLAAQFPDFEAP